MANIQMLQQQQAEYEKLLNQYGGAVNQFNWDADVYNRQVKEYQGLVDVYNTNPKVVAYNSAVENYNTNLVPQFNAARDAYNAQVNNWNTQRVRFSRGNLYYDVTPAEMQNMINSGKINANSPLGQAFIPQLNQYRPGAAPSLPTQPTEPDVAKPGKFTAVKPELTAEAPKDPGFTGQQIKALQGQTTMAQQERAGTNELGLVQRAQGQRQQPDSIIGGLLQNVRYST